MATKTLAPCLFFAITLVTQISAQVQLPDAPRSKPNRFLNRTNVTTLSLSAVALSADALSTQKMEAFQNWLTIGGITPTDIPHEINPIARRFVRSRTGTALYFGSAFAGEVGLTYLANRKHWKWAERLIPIATIGVETFWSARNYSLVNNTQQECVVHHPVVVAGTVNPCVH